MPYDRDDVVGRVIAAAIEVHRELGPGLLESAYELCLCHELAERQIPFRRQVALPVVYKGQALDCEYRIDVIVADELILELKSCDAIHPLHEAQLLTYLKLSGLHVGLILNFNVPLLKLGIKRMVL